MRLIKFIVLLLIVVGALNWGLWGFFQYDVIADFFGSKNHMMARIAYAIIGLAGVWGISFLFHPSICSCKKCSKD
ncbi:MAG: DUF378 domain-containing protein [Parachlamydiales bacterium]|nr:DUF378 domain-containing protein [Parachlamydiales bacterium]